MAANTKKLASFAGNDKGHVAITFGLILAPAVMFIGAAIDFGAAYKAQQKLQAAADAAVLAAVAMPEGTQPEARQAMASNVFKANTQGLTVRTPAPVVSGNTVTLNVQAQTNAAFLSIANLPHLTVRGASSSSVNYKAGSSSSTTTTTTTSSTGKVCLLALDPAANQAYKTQGTPNVKYLDCWAHTNSAVAATAQHTGAIDGGGNGAIAEGAGTSAVGGVTTGAQGVYVPSAVGGAAVVNDPFATVSAYQLPYSSYQSTFQAPSVSGPCKASGLNLKKNKFTLDPGRYCGGIVVMAGAQVTFNPGVYIIENGIFDVQSGASVTGSDVLFYFTGAAARFQVIGGAGGTVNLKGRTSGPSDLNGFLFIAHPNAWRGQTSRIQGGGVFIVEGMIYTPTQNIEITGNGSGAADTNGYSNFLSIIAKSFEFRGNGIFNLKTWTGASNMPNIMPTKPVTTTTTTISTTSTGPTIERVKLN